MEMNMQPQSILLSLPRELREQIWQTYFTLPQLSILIWTYPTSPTSPRQIFPYTACTDHRPLIPPQNQGHDCSKMQKCSKFVERSRYLKRVLSERLGLVVTCRKIYLESKHLLYTHQTFHYPTSPDGIHYSLTSMSNHYPNFSLIRDIKLDIILELDTKSTPLRSISKSEVQWWLLWNLLDTMQGLKHVDVEVCVERVRRTGGYAVDAKGAGEWLALLVGEVLGVEGRKVDVSVRWGAGIEGLEGYVRAFEREMRGRKVPAFSYDVE